MEQNKRDVELGHFLSLVLRHQPSAAYLKLEENGWADVVQLLDGCHRARKPLSMEDLERIVRENHKQRYSFNEEHTKIRANQGHSLQVDVELQEVEPPELLYHGTAHRFVEMITNQGITAQSRQHVHLSTDTASAKHVGARHGKPVILVVDATAMWRDGHVFYCSKNGVWLCHAVPFRYVQEVLL